MKEFDDILDVAKFFNMKIYDVVENYENQFWRGSFFAGENQIKIESLDNRIKYVYVDEKDNKSCNEYLMKYKIKDYDWKVYVDDFEKWQNCKVLKLENDGLDIVRATVETEHGTKLNRLVDYAIDKEDLVANRCVFMVEKYDEIEKNNTNKESLDSIINAAEQEKKPDKKEVKEKGMER